MVGGKEHLTVREKKHIKKQTNIICGSVTTSQDLLVVDIAMQDATPVNPQNIGLFPNNAPVYVLASII